MFVLTVLTNPFAEKTFADSEPDFVRDIPQLGPLSAASIAAMSAVSSGFVRLPKRPMIAPVRETRNLLKFQEIRPPNCALSAFEVKY